MKHNKDGQIAEEATAEFLRKQGYKILDKNWKTKLCEIDIIARKNKCIHFVEVKYRSNTDQGGGFEYITAGKVKQMSFAADIWVAKNKWAGEYVLSGASVFGPEFKIEFIEQI